MKFECYKTESCQLCFYFYLHMYIHLNIYKCVTNCQIFAAKTTPFRLEFYSDSYELAVDDNEGAEDKITSGFKVNYFQNAC